MKSTIFATAALVAAAAAESVGSAVVVNACDYDVYLFNTPSADGGYSEVDKTLSPSDTYTQEWTELTNGNGWSIKLSNSTSLASILQYEYTFQDDGTIWYDLSEVNGNPWDGDWEITSSTSTCTPKQQAYRYATDDAYGMQSCPQEASITVTLCSGDSSDDASAASASSSVAAETSSAASTTESAPASIVVATSTTESAPASVVVATTSSKAATTLQTSVYTTSAAVTSHGSDDVVVTVTEVATTTQWTHHGGPPSKRNAHHQHGARHPHGPHN